MHKPGDHTSINWIDAACANQWTESEVRLELNDCMLQSAVKHL